MPPSAAKIGAGLTAAVVAVSTAALLILLAAPLPPLCIAAGRVTVTGVALLIIGRRGLRPLLDAARRNPRISRRVVLAAALLAVHFGTWIASLGLTSVLRSMALVSTQPIFAGMLGRLLGDRVAPRFYIGAVVAVAGAAVLAGPGLLEGAGASLFGDALALVGAAAAAGYLAVGRSVRGELDLAPYLGAVHAVAAVLLIVAVAGWAALGGPAPVPAGGITWSMLVAVALLGLVPGVLGHGLLNWAVRFTPVHLVSLVVVVEPISATALVAVILGAQFSGLEFFGASVLLVGVAVGLRRR